MKNSYSNIFTFNKKILKKTIKNLSIGKVIGLPTETVYGLGGNAYSKRSIQKIFKLKGRPKTNPLIIHYYSINQVMDDVVLNKNFKKFSFRENRANFCFFGGGAGSAWKLEEWNLDDLSNGSSQGRGRAPREGAAKGFRRGKNHPQSHLHRINLHIRIWYFWSPTIILRFVALVCGLSSTVAEPSPVGLNTWFAKPLLVIRARTHFGCQGSVQPRCQALTRACG